MSRRYFKQAAVTLFFIFVSSLTAPPPARGQKNEVPSEVVGRSLMLQACVQCHDFKSVVSQRKTASAWRRTVNEMIWRGAPLVADEAEIITEYLAAAFGPEIPFPKAAGKASAEEENVRWAKYLPSGEGRSLVIQACMQCHDLNLIIAQRKTAAGWKRCVTEMIKLGSSLKTGEAEIVAKYLAASLGPEVPIPNELKKR